MKYDSKSNVITFSLQTHGRFMEDQYFSEMEKQGNVKMLILFFVCQSAAVIANNMSMFVTEKEWKAPFVDGITKRLLTYYLNVACDEPGCSVYRFLKTLGGWSPPFCLLARLQSVISKMAFVSLQTYRLTTKKKDFLLKPSYSMKEIGEQFLYMKKIVSTHAEMYFNGLDSCNAIELLYSCKMDCSSPSIDEIIKIRQEKKVKQKGETKA